MSDETKQQMTPVDAALKARRVMPKAKYDVKKLPQWAQKLIGEQNFAVIQANDRMNEIKQAHGALCDAESWFTIHGPSNGSFDHNNIVRLFFCSDQGTRTACSLMRGDYLLVIRRKHDFKGMPIRKKRGAL